MPTTAPSPRTLGELARVDVTYEVRQYCRWAFEEVQITTADAELAESLQQAAFTAGALAMRNLEAFLRKPRPNVGARDETDVVADHYFDQGWSRRQTIPTNPLLLWDDQSVAANDAARDDVNRHLAHLASTRVTRRGQFTWAADVNRLLVLRCFVSFVRELRRVHPHRASWFSEATSIARRRLSDPNPVLHGGATPTQVAIHTAG